MKCHVCNADNYDLFDQDCMNCQKLFGSRATGWQTLELNKRNEFEILTAYQMSCGNNRYCDAKHYELFQDHKIDDGCIIISFYDNGLSDHYNIRILKEYLQKRFPNYEEILERFRKIKLLI